MAEMPGTQSLTLDASQASTPHDPFWQSTPRYPQASIRALMAAVEKVVPPAPNNARQARRPHLLPGQAQGGRRPQCTHMSMDRSYGAHTCDACGRIPSIGWLYVCRQDEVLARMDARSEPVKLDVVPDTSDYWDASALRAAELRLSASVINGIRAQHYDVDQVEQLIAQKEHLHAVIQKAEHPPTQNTPTSLHDLFRSQEPTDNVIAYAGARPAPAVQGRSPMEALSTAAGTPTNTPAESTTVTPTKAHGKVSTRDKHSCKSQVCHTCRPFFQDRLPMSIESVLNGEQPAITEEEITHLPFLDPDIVRNLGLRQPLSPITRPRLESLDITLKQTDDLGSESPSSDDWTPTSASSSEYDVENVNSDDPYPCPGAAVCPLYSRQSGCAYDYGFDDGLRAVNHGYLTENELRAKVDENVTPDRSHYRLRHVEGSISNTPGGTSSTASSISLPTPTTLSLKSLHETEDSFDDTLEMRLGKASKAATICGVAGEERRRGGRLGSDISGKESSSSLGSEIEVGGGVALTEEAVETGLPDIITGDLGSNDEA